MPGVRRKAVAWGTRSYRSRADHVQGPRPSRCPRLLPRSELGCGEPARVLRPAGMWGARCPAPTLHPPTPQSLPSRAYPVEMRQRGLREMASGLQPSERHRARAF